MLSVNDLKGLLEVNRIATLPFIVAAYYQEFSFSHISGFIPINSTFMSILAFTFLVAALTLFSWLAFDILKLIDSQLGRFNGLIWSLTTVTFLSFAVLGFYSSDGSTGIHVSWFVASGACGLFLLDIQRKVNVTLDKMRAIK